MDGAPARTGAPMIQDRGTSQDEAACRTDIAQQAIGGSARQAPEHLSSAEQTISADDHPSSVSAAFGT